MASGCCRPGWSVRRSLILLAGLLLAGCSGIPPMRHRIDAGQETYLVFVADAPDGRGDLYAMTAVASDVVQLTFTLPAEWCPRVSPHGDVVAFLRSRDEGDTLHTRVWLLNLLNGAEREVVLPDSSGAPLDLAWEDDGAGLRVRTTAATFRVAAPPARPQVTELPGVSMPGARVGFPAFATVAACAGSGGNLCVFPDSGPAAVLARDARDAFRWGSDSVAYLSGGEVVIRPLGPGRSRTLRWREALRNPRTPDVFVKVGPRARDFP